MLSVIQKTVSSSCLLQGLSFTISFWEVSSGLMPPRSFWGQQALKMAPDLLFPSWHTSGFVGKAWSFFASRDCRNPAHSPWSPLPYSVSRDLASQSSAEASLGVGLVYVHRLKIREHRLSPEWSPWDPSEEKWEKKSRISPLHGD